jgi:hypothetical protein
MMTGRGVGSKAEWITLQNLLCKTIKHNEESMPDFKPRPGWSEWWRYRLKTGAGRHNYEVVFYDGDAAEIVVDYVYMGIDRHRYHLYGTRRAISDSYGWIRIDRIEKAAPVPNSDSPQSLDISDFEGNILFEYYHISRTPFHQHPHDMLTMMQPMGYADWQEYFEVVLVLHPFAEETFDALRYMHENPSDDYDPPDVDAIEEIEDILSMLDKKKLEIVGKQPE